MPGRRTPSRRGGTPAGGDTPAQVGSLVLSDTARFFNVYAGDAATVFSDLSDIVTLSNGGPGNWNNPQHSITYGGATGWLSLTTTNNAGSFDFTFTIDATSLTASTQTATVTFTDTRVSNSPQTLAITCVVSTRSPAMGVTPTTLAFSIVDGTATGTAQTITVSNATGLGTLASPTVGTITGAGAAYIDSALVSGSSPGPYTITVTPTATGGTPGGPYAFTMPISSSGATNSPVNVTGTVTVTTAQGAVISLSRTLDDAQFTVGGASPGTQTTGYTNVGSGSFAGVTIQSTSYSGDFSGWATSSLSNGIVSVAIDTSGISTEGSSYTDVVLADANAASTATYRVFIRSSLAVVQPLLSVSPGALGATVNNGSNSPSRIVTIQNVNGSFAELGIVTAAITPGVSWASVSAITNGQVTVSFATSALSNGTYSTALVITSSLATNSPVTVPINMIVQAVPTGYPSPAWTLPTTASHSTSTDAITYDPFSSPANPTGFA